MQKIRNKREGALPAVRHTPQQPGGGSHGAERSSDWDRARRELRKGDLPTEDEMVPTLERQLSRSEAAEARRMVAPVPAPCTGVSD